MTRLSTPSVLLIVVACSAPTVPEPSLESLGRAAGQKNLAPVDRTKPPPPAPEPSWQPPQVQRFTLKSNGLDVRLVEQHEVPLVSIVLVLREAGGDQDPAPRAGIATLTADLLDEGTKKHGPLDLANDIEALGASLSTGASWDAALVDMSTLARTLEPSMQLFTEVVTQPVFSPRELQRVRADRLTEILERKAEPRIVANEVLARALYGEQVYGRPMIGLLETLRGIQRRDVLAFYRSHYRVDNATLVVSGDVTREALESVLTKTLGRWPKSSGTVSENKINDAPARMGGLILVDRPEAPQSEMRIGKVGITRADPDYVTLDVLNTVLGGTFSSRLNHKLREELGYTYGAYSGFDTRRGKGPFVAGGAIKTDNTAAAVTETLQQLVRVRKEMIGADELRRAQMNIVRSLAARFEASSDIAAEIATLAVYGLPDDYFEKYVQAVRAVRPADMARVAQTHLDPDVMTIVIVGDSKTVEPELKKLGRSIERRDAAGPLQ